MAPALDLSELRPQWRNPGDILSLLLLVGGDVVQKALAQMVGAKFRILSIGPALYLTPVAFSFGWVAYAFSSLMSILGDQRLMPDPDCAIRVVNCDNAFVRDNSSWVLGRILRDSEGRVKAAAESAPLESSGNRRSVSIMIDIFTAAAVPPDRNPVPSMSWIYGWAVIVIQQVIAIIPWVLYGDWAIFMVTVSGTALALLTGAIPQWSAEKWSAGRLRSRKQKAVALTRGNGHDYAMIILGHHSAWDLEALAAARLTPRSGTAWCMLMLTLLWSLLLITVSGLRDHTWFLLGIGSLGMLQNVHAAASFSKPAEYNINLEPYGARPTIVGYRMDSLEKENLQDVDDSSSDEEPEGTPLGKPIAEPGVTDVMGALIELEKLLSGVGCSLLPVFFPGALQYDPARYRYNREKKFWKLAYRNIKKPVQRKTTPLASDRKSTVISSN